MRRSTLPTDFDPLAELGIDRSPTEAKPVRPVTASRAAPQREPHPATVSKPAAGEPECDEMPTQPAADLPAPRPIAAQEPRGLERRTLPQLTLASSAPALSG